MFSEETFLTHKKQEGLFFQYSFFYLYYYYSVMVLDSSNGAI